MSSVHPRPNPIIAALYTLRDLDVDVVVIHGPAGCGFMASRMIEEAGIRVVTSSMNENDLIFGASEPLIRTLKEAEERFRPRTMAVIGTCASMIIGEDVSTSIKRSGVRCDAFHVDCHGCMGNNTEGAVKAIESAMKASLISKEEAERQIVLLREATRIEKKTGMASEMYIQPTRGPTKLKVAELIKDHLSDGKRIAVAMIAKKELAYRFADMFLAVEEAKRKLGGSTFFIGNLDPDLGLPRIRRYARDILAELDSNDLEINIEGGLDEYAFAGNRIKKRVEEFRPDLLVIAGIPHFYGSMGENDILITDQPRQLSNYIYKGHRHAVGEISSHSMVMNTRRIIPLETGDTLRELCQ